MLNIAKSQFWWNVQNVGFSQIHAITYVHIMYTTHIRYVPPPTKTPTWHTYDHYLGSLRILRGILSKLCTHIEYSHVPDLPSHVTFPTVLYVVSSLSLYTVGSREWGGSVGTRLKSTFGPALSLHTHICLLPFVVWRDLLTLDQFMFSPPSYGGWGRLGSLLYTCNNDVFMCDWHVTNTTLHRSVRGNVCMGKVS